VTLAGTLTRPTGEGPFPALVLVSGSGPQDRDETIFDHKPFAVLADALTRHGIAVLRYDDRGVGESVGEFATATTDDFTGDAWAAWQWLANQPQIDPDRIGIGGHSEGALVASLLAGEHTDPAFVLLLAPPGVNGDRITRTQTMAMAIAEGASRAAADRIGQLLGDVNRLAKQRSEVDDEYRGKLKLLIDECAADLESLGEPLQPAERAALESGLTALPSPWYRRFLTLEPQAALEHVQRPVLAILGQFDLQVPAKENAAALRTALQGNDRATVAIIEGINHLLQPSTKGVPSEYAVQETTIAPAVLEKIVQWVSDQVAPTSSGN
jgi:pimeloyl-ACP methyl ester carboxylesterase